jgi:hypothetical protein
MAQRPARNTDITNPLAGAFEGPSARRPGRCIASGVVATGTFRCAKKKPGQP